jgi:hypothetical protein
MDKYSDTLNFMLKSNQGFRNDKFLDSKIYNAFNIIYFEITTLYKTGLVDFCNKHYNTNIDCYYTHLHEEWKADGMTAEEIQEEENHCFSNEAPEFASSLMKFVENYFKSKKVYAIWLTSKEGVNKNYFYNLNTSNQDKCISKYKIPTDALPISDLDDQGTLFLTKIHPKNLLILNESEC